MTHAAPEQNGSKAGQTALVTGGSRGIGKAIVRALAQEGYQVYFTYASRKDEAEALCRELAEKGCKAAAFCVDGADSEAIGTFFKEHIKDKTTLAVLVNNAGITKDGLILRMKDEDFDRVLHVNLRSAFIFLREAAKLMTKQRFGRIVNISSVVGQSGNAGQINYSASKAGMHGLTMSAAKELASRNITVNSVAPGFIATEMTMAISEEAKASYNAAIPLGRMGSPEDVAQAVAFLASGRADYITGQILAVNGGMYT